MQAGRDSDEPAQGTAGPRSLHRLLADLGGACGDLGTLLPHTIGAIAVAGLAPAGVLIGFGAFFIGSGLFYGLPMAVQPMKAVSAVLVTGQVGPAEVAAAGILLGATLLVLGATGTIGWLARMIPQSVSAGLQLGLGISMALIGLELVGRTPWLGALAVAALAGLILLPRFPAALGVLAVTVAAGVVTGAVTLPGGVGPSWPAVSVTVPAPSDVVRALQLLIVPQLPLTLTNAVIVTALVARELFPDTAGRASERNLALTSGAANLLLAPLGAMPMCHGAGGLQAQHRFGARTAIAPIALGIVLLLLGVLFSNSAAALLAVIPAGAVGALLMFAGGDLAMSRRLFDAQPSCWPVIAVVAAVTAIANPAAALLAGLAGEMVRKGLVSAWQRRSRVRSP